ncbi:Bifunctional polymyxin resistance protein ArnA [Aquicella siphonis]|uniref:Bifunctional polymyxin resistance protein ArnA n=1 Tax=Aquicella siphonis TaxID=254247 RepID=A0A5E4PHC8_9COXI|nr:NAD-dependent epimerase/dehydratase family protein [Aquicella siphonis]VVC75726.1 Bifunctional polymyxin resistance protein ArnA [Aquicella siphonis]
MHILVTGGCGFIGSHIVEHHIASGDSVHVVDDLTTGSLKNIEPFKSHPNLRFDQADIVTWPELNNSVAKADLVYHMAAVVGIYRVLAEPIKVISTNIAGTERVLRAVAARGNHQRIIIASSSEVYGHSQKDLLSETDHLIVESAAQPRWSYAISKLADEALGIAYSRAAGMKLTIIRLFNTVGPRQSGRYGMVLPRFIKQAVSGEPMTIFGDGTQTRCFSDVRDIVASLAKLAENPKAIGEIVNVGKDHEITINELATIVRERANSNSNMVYIPYEKAYTSDFVDIKKRHPDLTKFKSLTNYNYKWTLEKTIDDLITMELETK